MYHKTRWNISYCLRILAKAPKLETVTTKYSYKIPPQKKNLLKHKSVSPAITTLSRLIKLEI